MAIDVVLPKVDMDMESGVIAQWRVTEGAAVREGDVLFEMETAKSLMEVEAPASGVIRGLAPITGEPVAVGTVVAVIERAHEGAAASQAVTSGATHADSAAGNASAAQSSAASAVGMAPASAPATGGSAHAMASSPPSASGSASATTAASGAGSAASAPAAPSAAGAGELRATPYARSLARTHAVDLVLVSGSGPRGRIGGDDVHTHLAGMASATSATPTSPSEPAQAAGRLVPFTPTRRVAARRLTQSVQSIPHFYLTAQVDMGALRQAVNAAARGIRRAAGAAPTTTVALAWLCARTLAEHPLLNASVEGDAARVHDGVHVGVAMDRDGDLVVPVLRDAHARDLGALAAEFRRLRDAVRSRTITPADQRGATFTLSSLEMYGVDAYTAIISPPQSAILAVGRTQDVPVGRDGQVVLRPVATLTLSSDHRIVDGVTAARFMADLRRAIESPPPLA